MSGSNVGKLALHTLGSRGASATNALLMACVTVAHIGTVFHTLEGIFCDLKSLWASGALAALWSIATETAGVTLDAHLLGYDGSVLVVF